MKPYPLSALNHLTVPVAIDETPPLLLRNGQRRRTARIRYSLKYSTESSTYPRESDRTRAISEADCGLVRNTGRPARLCQKDARSVRSDVAWRALAAIGIVLEPLRSRDRQRRRIGDRHVSGPGHAGPRPSTLDRCVRSCRPAPSPSSSP